MWDNVWLLWSQNLVAPFTPFVRYADIIGKIVGRQSVPLYSSFRRDENRSITIRRTGSRCMRNLNKTIPRHSLQPIYPGDRNVWRRHPTKWHTIEHVRPMTITWIVRWSETLLRWSHVREKTWKIYRKVRIIIEGVPEGAKIVAGVIVVMNAITA